MNGSQLYTFFVYGPHRSWGVKQHFIMGKETMYLPPEVEVYEVLAEGILCSSNENVGEEDGNGGFA
jgi:hypothetical protein